MYLILLFLELEENKFFNKNMWYLFRKDNYFYEIFLVEMCFIGNIIMNNFLRNDVIIIFLVFLGENIFFK